jgi:glycosyltransferase involved in cell wall biosynthesis
MKIGIDISCIAGGRGPARYTTEIVKGLSTCCQEKDEFVLYSPFDHAIEDLPANFSFRYLPLQKHRPWLNWTLPFQARRDALDLMFFPANDCWLWRAVQTVITLHDVAQKTIIAGYQLSWKDKLQVTLQLKRMGKVTSRIITVSKYSAQEINKAVPNSSDKVVVIYNGLSDICEANISGMAKQNGYILFVGGLDRRKNLERLLQAYKILINKGRKEKLVLIGSCGKNSKLYYNMPELVIQNGLENWVDIKSNVNDAELINYYSHAAMFVFPSLVEGFGLPLLEAMKCGCPIASSNAASLPEVGGDAVLYFDPYNVDQMADCMERILTDSGLRETLINKGYQQVKKFSWQKASQYVYCIFTELSTIYR